MAKAGMDPERISEIDEVFDEAQRRGLIPPVWKDYAAQLGVETRTVTNWRKRGDFPKKHYRAVALSLGKELGSRWLDLHDELPLWDWSIDPLETAPIGATLRLTRGGAEQGSAMADDTPVDIDADRLIDALTEALRTAVAQLVAESRAEPPASQEAPAR